MGKIIANGNGLEVNAGGVAGNQYGAVYSSYARGDATASGGRDDALKAGAIVGYHHAFVDIDLYIGTGAGGQGTSNLSPSSGIL